MGAGEEERGWVPTGLFRLVSMGTGKDAGEETGGWGCVSWDWCQTGGSWVSLEQSPQPLEMGGPEELRLSGGWWSRDQSLLVHVGKHEPLVEGGPMSTQLLGPAEAWPPYISALGGLGAAPPPYP